MYWYMLGSLIQSGVFFCFNCTCINIMYNTIHTNIYNYILLITITPLYQGKSWTTKYACAQCTTINFTVLTDFCCMIIFEAAHLVSCCNKLKLLFSIFTLIEVKGKKNCYLIDNDCLSTGLACGQSKQFQENIFEMGNFNHEVAKCSCETFRCKLFNQISEHFHAYPRLHWANHSVLGIACVVYWQDIFLLQALSIDNANFG